MRDSRAPVAAAAATGASPRPRPLSPDPSHPLTRTLAPALRSSYSAFGAEPNAEQHLCNLMQGVGMMAQHGVPMGAAACEALIRRYVFARERLPPAPLVSAAVACAHVGAKVKGGALVGGHYRELLSEVVKRRSDLETHGLVNALYSMVLARAYEPAELAALNGALVTRTPSEAQLAFACWSNANLGFDIEAVGGLREWMHAHIAARIGSLSTVNMLTVGWSLAVFGGPPPREIFGPDGPYWERVEAGLMSGGAQRKAAAAGSAAGDAADAAHNAAGKADKGQLVDAGDFMTQAQLVSLWCAEHGLAPSLSPRALSACADGMRASVRRIQQESVAETELMVALSAAFPATQGHVLECGYSVDVRVTVEEGRHVLFEFDGPVHFNGTPPRPNGATVLKRRLLRSLGHTLVVVPYWEWDRVRTLSAAEQRAYLYQAMLRELDGREGAPAGEALAQ